MATWRIAVDMEFDVTSDELAELVEFSTIRGGPRGELLSERIALDTRMGRERLDHLISQQISKRQSQQTTVNGTTVKSGTDGELVLPSEFRSNGVTLANADVGRVIRISAGQTPLAARGHYRIISRNGPNSVNVEGVVPVAGTGLAFDIDEQAEFLAMLVSRV